MKILIFLFLLISCKEKDEQGESDFFPLNIDLDRSNDISGYTSQKYSLYDSTKYFPDSTFTKATNEWYTSYLTRLSEPILYNNPNFKCRKIYRFTWLRTFQSPIVITYIQYSKNNLKLAIKVNNGSGGYFVGKINQIDTISIDNETAFTILSKIKRNNFWEMKSDIDDLGIDGAIWLLEGASNEKYHVVSRWGGSELYIICNYFLKLSKLKIIHKY